MAQPESDKQTASPPDNKSKSKALRLNPKILSTAEIFAQAACRTLPTQIEYWAKLGHLLERAVSTEEIHALMTAQKRLGKIEVIDPPAIDVDTVLKDIETAHANGTIKDGITNASFVYDSGPDNLIRRSDQAGNVTYGKLENNQFIEVERTAQ